MNAYGGFTMAQVAEPKEVEDGSRGAITTGVIDFFGTGVELAHPLLQYQQCLSHQPPLIETLSTAEAAVLNRIFTQLRMRTGHDFTHYKRPTILRRLRRRMQSQNIEHLSDYLTYLEEHPEELERLHKEFLISVTTFFRNSSTFLLLQQQIIPQLFVGKSQHDVVRVWVPGCATGEEAYSLAVLLDEQAAVVPNPPDLKIFATDIDADAIAVAREGFYDAATVATIGVARLRRFFSEEMGGYRVKKELRESILFTVHNLLSQPPFSQLDLISCRNLLIYFNRELQQQALGLFHYALRSSGYLCLGSSESADTPSALFKSLHKQERIYQRLDQTGPVPPFGGMPLFVTQAMSMSRSPQEVHMQTLVESYQRWRLRQYAPPCLLVNEQYDIVHVFGNAGRYLQVREGPATLNVLQEVLPSLRVELHTALFRAFQNAEHSTSRPLRIEIGNEVCLLRLRVGPVAEPAFPSVYVEVVFEELPNAPGYLGTLVPGTGRKDGLITHLEKELQQTKQHLQTVIREHEAAHEELKAANEELQSMNEEVTTVNQTLKTKIEELSHANSDLQNLMASTDIGTLFLDQNLCIKRFTPRIQDLFYITPMDIGRPLLHFAHQLQYNGLAEDAKQVLAQATLIEQEIQSKHGRWYMVRLFPYYTLNGVIDGVVITCVEITEFKRIQQELAQRAQQQQAVADLGQMALESTDLSLLVDTAVGYLCQTLDVEFCKLLELLPGSEAFRLSAGRGWQAGLIGQTIVSAQDKSQASYTLTVDEPVVVEDLASERRFQPSFLLSSHAIVSGITVLIQGVLHPYGVLGVHSAQRRSFTRDDVHFVQAVANVLAQAIARKSGEEVLRESELRYRNTFENAAVGMAHIRHDGAWLRVNERLCTIIGYTQAELQQQTFQALTDTCDLTLELPQFEQLLHGESEGYHLEKRYRHKAGYLVWTHVTMSLQRDETGRPLYGIAIIEDISARKVAEERLLFLTETSTTLASSLDYTVTLQRVAELMVPHLADWCAVDIVGPDGGIELAAVAHVDPSKVQWARALREQHPPAMDAPQGLPNVIRTGRAEFYPEISEELILRSEPDDEQLAIIRQIGFKSVIIVPLAARGQVLGALTLVWSDSNRHYQKADLHFAEDVAQRAALAVDNARLYHEAQAAEAQLKQFNQILEQRVSERTAELERSNRELDQFVYVASHDLKAPMRGIQHLAQWIVADAGGVLPPPSKTHLAKLIGRVRRMEGLLNDLLIYSTVGRENHEPEWVDCNVLVEDVSELLMPPSGFTISLEEKLPTLWTERVPLETVFRNLIGNAIKHHHRPSEGNVRITAQNKGQVIEFSVTDDGPGVEAAYYERIFQMFQTLKPRDQVEGSGIGLTVVKKIVESRKGRIDVVSSLGQGTTFRFLWPKQ